MLPPVLSLFQRTAFPQGRLWDGVAAHPRVPSLDSKGSRGRKSRGIAREGGQRLSCFSVYVVRDAFSLCVCQAVIKNISFPHWYRSGIPCQKSNESHQDAPFWLVVEEVKLAPEFTLKIFQVALVPCSKYLIYCLRIIFTLNYLHEFFNVV